MTKQDGGKLNGHHSEPAITQECQRYSKIHESNRNILTWRSRSCLSCGVEVNAVPDDRMNEKTSQNPRRVAHCRVSSLVMVCRRSFAAKANLLAIETALLTRRQQSADHKDEVCQVGVTVNTE